jgi:hypothetical protein
VPTPVAHVLSTMSSKAVPLDPTLSTTTHSMLVGPTTAVVTSDRSTTNDHHMAVVDPSRRPCLASSFQRPGQVSTAF